MSFSLSFTSSKFVGRAPWMVNLAGALSHLRVVIWGRGLDEVVCGGNDRQQGTLFPELLDDNIGE
jgi:hypothetical protein